MMRSRKAEWFMPLFTIAIIFMFLTVILTASNRANNFDGERPVLGVKQQHVIDAHTTGNNILLYAQQAAHKAATQVALQPDLEREITAQAQEIFANEMRQYPLFALRNTYTATLDGNSLVFASDTPITIPVGEQIAVTRTRGETLGIGVLTTWPSEDYVITSIFGRRDFSGGSTFHSGIDVRARPFGQPVFAVAQGTVTPNTQANRLSLRMNNGFTCEYLHVTPAQNTQYSVQEGDVIAQITNDGYAPHLDLRCYSHGNRLNTNTARELFGPQHVRPFQAQADTMFVDVRANNVAYVDPFCLFSPEIREQLTYTDTITGWNYRQGTTRQVQEAQTCQAYVQAGLIPSDQAIQEATIPEVDPEASTDVNGTQTDSRYDNAVQSLQQTSGRSGMTLYAYATQQAIRNNLPPEAVIAMIVIESDARINPTSPTSVQGIMQATCPVVADSLQRNNEPGFSNTQECNVLRADPEISIRAGAEYLALKFRRFEGLTHQAAFAAAEYNGGFIILPLVQELQERGNADPSYEEVMSRVTPSYLAGFSDYSQWTNEQLTRKQTEIRNHGTRFVRYYQMGGGTAPPQYVSERQYGVYQLPLEVSVSVDLSQRLSLMQLKQQAEQISVQDQQQRFFQQNNLLACGTYEEELAQATSRCQAYFEQGCACPLPLPHHGQEAITGSGYTHSIQEIIIAAQQARLVTEDEELTVFLDWLGDATDDSWTGRFGMVERLMPIPQIPLPVTFGQELIWRQQTRNTLLLDETAQARVYDGIMWVTLDRQAPALVVTQYPPLCQYTIPKQYCQQDAQLQISTVLEPPVPPPPEPASPFEP